jgi:hypothetical protein
MLRFPAEAIHGVRQLFVLNMVKYLAIESTDDLYCSVSETYCAETSISTYLGAADFVLSQFHSESIGKVAEHLFSSVCLVVRAHHVVKTFVRDNFLLFESLFIEFIVPRFLGFIFERVGNILKHLVFCNSDYI